MRRRHLRFRPALLIAATVLVSAAAPRSARSEWLAPLTVETAETLPKNQIDLALGTTYMRNRRFPSFTPPGGSMPGAFLHSQDLLAIPEIALRAAVGSMVEIQASYELLNLHESTMDGINNQYGGGDARLFTKIHAVNERTWIPAVGVRFGTKLPDANSTDRLGTDETDFFIQALASKRIGLFSLHVNLGIALLGIPKFAATDNTHGQDDLFTYAVGAVSPTLALTREWGARALLEATGTTGSRLEFGNNENAMRGGFQVVHGGWTLYAGASAGLYSAAEKYGVMGGAIYAFDVDRLVALFE
jgi:hypothetical protein